MTPCLPDSQQDFATGFEVFHELMANRIRKILLVFSSYDAYIMEQGGSLTSRIVNEYRGLNLSHPPRLIRVSSAASALALLAENKFDLVIITPQLDDMDCFALGRAIKQIDKQIPIILLCHNVHLTST